MCLIPATGVPPTVCWNVFMFSVTPCCTLYWDAPHTALNSTCGHMLPYCVLSCTPHSYVLEHCGQACCATLYMLTHIKPAKGAVGRWQRTYMRELIGGLFAASILLQRSFLIGAQDFGRWAMPFSFCDIKRVEPAISSVSKREEKKGSDGLAQSSRITLLQIPRLPASTWEAAELPHRGTDFSRR